MIHFIDLYYFRKSVVMRSAGDEPKPLRLKGVWTESGKASQQPVFTSKPGRVILGDITSLDLNTKEESRIHRYSENHNYY